MTAEQPDNNAIEQRLLEAARRIPAAKGRLNGAAVTIVTVLLAISVTLIWRRWAGALDAELPRLGLAAVALTFTGGAAISRIIRRRVAPLPLTRLDWALDQYIAYGGSAAMILAAVGCCYPAERNSDWLIWLPLLISDQFWRQHFFDNGRPGHALGEISADRLVADEPAAISEAVASTIDPAQANVGQLIAASELASSQHNDQMLQQLFRVRLDNGDEAIYGTVRADFLANQRHATLHVGFCPPLVRQPQIEVDPCDDSQAKIKVVQAFAHGARLEVRLPAAAEFKRSVLIDMAAIPHLELGESFDDDPTNDDVEAA